MEVRRARPDEIPALMAIEDSGDGIFREFGYAAFPPEPEDDWSGAEVIFVIGDPAVGFCRVDLVDGEPFIEQLSVLPDHMQRGYGTALMRTAEQWAREQGYDQIWLTTFTQVPWNAPFYSRLGYEVLDVPPPGLRRIREHEVAIGNDDLGERCAMRLALS